MKVTLNVPALFPVLNGIGADDINQLKLNNLQKLLSCADSRPVSDAPYQSWLYEQFSGSILPVEQIPVAGLTAMLDGLLNAGNRDSNDGWMRADPVYLHPDTHSLVMQDPERLKLRDDEIAGIRNEIAPLFKKYDAILHTPHPRRWYLRFENNMPDVSCTPLHDVIMKPINQYLPQGRDVSRWHTLLNEIQMILATLDINLYRQQERQLPVNSLWFWGNGPLLPLGSRNYDYCSGDSELLESLCLHGNSCYEPMGQGADDSLIMSGRWNHGLIVYEPLMRARQLNDPGLWLRALQGCEDSVITPLVRQLRDGDIQELSLMSDSGFRFHCFRRDIRAFWRRVRPASRYLLP